MTSLLRRLLGSRAREPARAPEGQTIYAIGDVHGCADLLAALLEDIEGRADAGEVMVVGLGDYIDRGPQSPLVLDQLLAARRSSRFSTCFLLGNHEQFLLRFLADATVGPTWCEHGGLATMAAYGVSAPRAGAGREPWEAARQALAALIPGAHMQLLSDMPVAFTAGGYFFTHAGARPGTPLEDQAEEDLLWIRRPFLESRVAFDRVVVHGHSADMVAHADDRRIGVDTGAYATGVLSAVRLQSERRTLLQARRRGGVVERAI